jgi:hypothetical protein
MTVMGCSTLNRIWYDNDDPNDIQKLKLPADVYDVTKSADIGGAKVW